ncbi:MAG: hypothetical protein Q8N22_02600 [bacterium]|nr:hypothetical protein [bacterium]
MPGYILDTVGRIRTRGTGGNGGGIWFTESGTPTTDTVFIGRGGDAEDWTGFYSGGWRMAVLDNGNVGIGTAGPSYLLEVNGTLRANDYYSGDGTQGLTNSASYWLCADATCTTKCQATIKDGLITGCP